MLIKLKLNLPRNENVILDVLVQYGAAEVFSLGASLK